MAIELAAGDALPAVVFSCGQVLEKLLGYDAAADPQHRHPIWRLLAIPRPAGIKLLPEYWDLAYRPRAEQLPPSPISLIVQYKRPEYMQGGRAKQWDMWRRPYFRFSVVPHQQRALKRLEQAVAAGSVVRYACPAFWRRTDLDQARLARTVAAESGFVSPSLLDGHKVWTFDRPGLEGRANPRRTRHMFESVEQLLAPFGRPAQISAELVRSSRLDYQLTALAEAAREREPRVRFAVDRWIRSVERADLGLTGSQLGLVGAYASVMTLLSRIGAAWYLVAPT